MGGYISEQAADGNLMGGIGVAVAAATALIPFALAYGVVAALGVELGVGV